jgi:tetratricopeptide (TPR) repeat protein
VLKKMKNILYLFLFITQFSFAQNAFEQANQLYQKGSYQEAVSIYESILASGKQSAELYFNLGNCYYKMHKVAPSIYNFEKAIQLNPNDEEIQTNLAFAQKTAIDDVKDIQKVGFSKLIQDFTSSYHYDTWAWITIVLAFIFLGLFIGYYFSRTTFKKRVFFTVMCFSFVAIVISYASGMYERNRINNEKSAIVFVEKVNVKSEPRLTSPNTFVLHEGTKVYILESIANWKKIQLADETSGWIESESIKELN